MTSSDAKCQTTAKLLGPNETRRARAGARRYAKYAAADPTLLNNLAKKVKPHLASAFVEAVVETPLEKGAGPHVIDSYLIYIARGAINAKVTREHPVGG